MASSDNSAPGSLLDVPAPGPGVWRLNINVPAGDWGVCWLVTDGQRIARCDTAQELLVFGGRLASLQLMPDEAAP